MTSMWMVQNDDGKYLDYTDGQEYEFMSKTYGQAFAKLEAEEMANVRSGHLVEMVTAKPKVPVSQEEAEMLRKAGADGYSVGKTIVNFVNNAGLDTVICSDENLLQREDRLMRAYVDGYTVTEPTKYNVKVPHTTDGTYYTMTSAGIGTAYRAANHQETQQFTEAEIKHYGLEDCERVEISTEDSNE